MSFNVNGSFVDKLDWMKEGNESLKEIVQKFDCVFICEAWTNKYSCVDMDGYAVYRKERVRREGAVRDSGGIVCYFKEFVAKGVSEIEWDANEDGMCFKLDKDYFGMKEHVFLLFVYMRPRQSTREEINAGVDCFDLLTDMIARVCDDGAVVVCGDLNGRAGSGKPECLIIENDDVLHGFENRVQFENVFRVNDLIKKGMDVERVCCDRIENEYGRRLLNMCMECDLIFLNRMGGASEKMTFIGHQGMSVIDHVLCDRRALESVFEYKVHDISVYSDHCYVSFSISTGMSEQGAGCRGETETRTRAKWVGGKKEEFKIQMGTEVVDDEVNELRGSLEGDIDSRILEQGIYDLTEIIVNVGREVGHVKECKLNACKRGVRGEEGSWYDDEVRDQGRKFTEGQRRFYDMQTDENRVWMCHQRNVYRKMCRQKKREFNRQKSERLYELSKSNPKQFWREVKGGDSKKAIPDLDFYEHFKNLAARESIVSEEARVEIERGELTERGNSDELLDSPITMNELEENLKLLKGNKAAGCDLVLNEFLVNASNAVKLTLLTIFNQILDLEYFPECWAKGEISAVFKQGDRNDVNNYRGITVQSCLGKFFTRIMNNRLTKWTDRNNILYEGQYGFRQGRGTVDCLFILHGLIELLLAKKKRLYVAFIDYEKAYDYLSRAALWLKLLESGVSHKFIRLYKNMYSKIRLCVKSDKHMRFFDSKCGLIQGESTSPLLFSMFVNDLDNYLHDVSLGTHIQDIVIQLLLFADDMALFSETREGLQKGLDNLGDYCAKWGITVNTRKTKIVVFRKGGQLGRLDVWSYMGQNIEVVTSFKYLGCFLSPGGSFAKCIQELTNSARRALFSVKKYFAKNEEILTSMKLQIFDSMVSPILFYCSEVWGSRRADPIEKFHLYFLKNVLNVKVSTPNCFVYGELGVFPLHIERQARVVAYWLKIIALRESNPNSFVYKVYLELYNLSLIDPREVTWVSLVRDILNQNGFGNVWLMQGVTNKESFLREIRLRIKDIYLQGWWAEVEQSSNGRLFRYIKGSFKFEKYLDSLQRSKRIALSRIRLSSHIFSIERGRWTRGGRQNRENRLCTLCRVIECEYHCLVQCPRYVNEREERLPTRLRDRPCMYEFLRFLMDESEEKVRNLASLCLAVQIEHKKYV